jgi:hypothetical protein
MATSPELSGGAGFTFEDAVVAHYLICLLAEESAPGLNGRIVARVAQQQAAFGEPLDDLIVNGIGPDRGEARLSLQIKRELTITASDSDFSAIVRAAAATLEKTDFREDVDRVGAVTGFVAEAARRALTEVCEWARLSKSREDFYARFEQPGFAGNRRKEIVEAFGTILTEKSADEIYRLLRHFVFTTFDFMHEGAKDDATAMALARKAVLRPEDGERGGDLWTQLRLYAREGAGRAAHYARPELIVRLSSKFRFTAADSFKAALDRLSAEADATIAAIPNQIDGLEVTRPSITEKVALGIGAHSFAQLVGLPGTGKSVALRNFAASLREKGNVLLLKSDRLNGNSWNTYAASIGLPLLKVEDILVEIGVTGTPILLIDGLDRLGEEHRGIILDLANIISTSPLLSEWKIVATLRDNGIEPVRTWLPAKLAIGSGTGTIEIAPFDDDEADFLSKERPILRPLLFGDDKVKEIARRPFFCAVLLKALNAASGSAHPRSEVELARVWWDRGGYDAVDTRVAHRRKALLKLAKHGGEAPGKGISTEDIDLDALKELKDDGVVHDDRKGHTVLFTHDIFFEWAFLEYLIGKGDAWPAEIKRLGELPIFARTVELLSQAEFAGSDDWEKHLDKLEGAAMRSQWARSWMLAPFESPLFSERAWLFTRAIVRADTTRMARLPVWMTAEKSRANPRILEIATGGSEKDRKRTVQAADALAWPSDIPTWRRFTNWLLDYAKQYPETAIPNVVDAFSIWQNMLADIPNRISQNIFDLVMGWLVDIEDRSHPEEWKWDKGPWEGFSSATLTELETALRIQVLRAASTETEKVATYLRRVADRKRLRHEAAKPIFQMSWRLMEHHADELKTLLLAELFNRLPKQIADDPPDTPFGHMFSHHDWDHLGLHDELRFSPNSPLHEPFASLFKHHPAIGRDLICQIANHAITAWNQLFRLDPERQGTPIPLVIDFPWGSQIFWGDARVYMWSRGHWGPHVVVSGFMSLEEWAFGEIDRGREVDDVIKEVVEGHDSVAVLAIAVAVSLYSEKITPAILALIEDQRLWDYDTNRAMQDGPMNPNTFMADMLGGKEHVLAVKAGNERSLRQQSLNNIAARVMIGGTDEQRAAMQAAILAFPYSTPYEFEEEVGNLKLIQHHKERAGDFAAVTSMDNFFAKPTQDGKQYEIYVANPKAQEPERLAEVARAEAGMWQFNLAGWAEKALREGKLDLMVSLDVAFAKAKEMDQRKLFNFPHVTESQNNTAQGAVAGAAAALLIFGPQSDLEKMKWATDVIYRAARVPEVAAIRSSGLYHPGRYASRALGVMVNRGQGGAKAKEELLRLVGSAMLDIQQQAFFDAMQCWDRDSNLGWAAIRLILNISIGVKFGTPNAYTGFDNDAQQKHTAKLVNAAVKELRSGKIPSVLPVLPNAWRDDGANPEFSPPNGRRRPGRLTREPDSYLRWDVMQRVMEQFPHDKLLADQSKRVPFLALCDHLLKWTIERMAPPWMDANERRRDGRSSDIYQFRHALMRLLARVALMLDVNEVDTRILASIFAMDSEPAMSLIEPFSSLIIAKGIMDDPVIAPQAVPVITKCVERSIATHDWENARHHDGDLFGHSNVPFLRDIMLVSVEDAPMATRFANGDWRDIGAVMPFIDLFVRAAGDIPFATDAFLKLVDRAGEHYPAEAFADQVLAFLAHQRGTPVGWRDWMHAARLAAAVQAIAQRMAPLQAGLGQKLLKILDRLVEMGDRRSAALQTSEWFRTIRA